MLVVGFLGLDSVLLTECSILDPCYEIWEELASNCRGNQFLGRKGFSRLYVCGRAPKQFFTPLHTSFMHFIQNSYLKK